MISDLQEPGAITRTRRGQKPDSEKSLDEFRLTGPGYEQTGKTPLSRLMIESHVGGLSVWTKPQ